MRIRIAIVAAIVAVAPVAASAHPGIGASRYYVGMWTCWGGRTNETPTRATVTFVLENGALREHVFAPVQPHQSRVYESGGTYVYDSRHNRYLYASVDNGGGWEVASASSVTDATSRWTDLASNDTMGYDLRSRTDANHFAMSSYATMSSAHPSFTAACTRST